MGHIADRFTSPTETAEDRVRAYMRLSKKQKRKLWRKAEKVKRS